jgi:hypothetical protein
MKQVHGQREAAQIVRQEQGGVDHAFYEGQIRPLFYVQFVNRPKVRSKRTRDRADPALRAREAT